jgi:glyoxylase-like metal-dependent hydrolase (beta-lactamase superfamily II)
MNLTKIINRKCLIAGGLLVLNTVLLPNNTAIAQQYAETGVDMRLRRVSEHVYYVQGEAGVATDNEGFISNATAIITGEGIVVVDALGTPSLAALFLKKLKAISDLPVVKLIATHYHADHIYGLQVFKEQGATIIAPAGFREYLDAPISAERLEERQFTLDPWVNEDTYLVQPDEIIDSNTKFMLGNIKFEINYLGQAHSDGDLSVLIKPDGVLISGDLIFEGRVPFTGSADTAHWLDLLQSLDNTDLVALVPGHGPVGDDPNEAIALTARYLQSVRMVMKEAVDEFVDFDTAFKAADWSEFESLPAFNAAHRGNAYGIYLSIEKESLAE